MYEKDIAMTVNQRVSGSSPDSGASNKKGYQYWYPFLFLLYLS